MTIRDDRLPWPVVGIGGFLSFAWQTQTGAPSIKAADELIDVREWTIQHIYRNLEIPGSGNFGSILRRRVAVDFKWTAAVDLDLSDPKAIPDAQPIPPPDPPQPYFEARLEGQGDLGFYAVAMRFQVGDPSQMVPALDAPAFSGLYYFCPDVKLDEVLVTDSSRAGKDGKGVVSYLIRGSGSAPLQRYRNGVWIGAGGFGFSDPAIGGPKANA